MRARKKALEIDFRRIKTMVGERKESFIRQGVTPEKGEVTECANGADGTLRNSLCGIRSILLLAGAETYVGNIDPAQ
jgi:hypothetical protein